MWFRVKRWISNYHAHMAKRHYKRQRYALCLHHLMHLKNWDNQCFQKPIFAGYLAMCHYQLKVWNHLTEEVERALFLLRRHIEHNNEALVLWQELKSHLADLRFIDQSHIDVKREMSDAR